MNAVGGSGKTALASKFSTYTGMPVLDLGIHPPVADNTLTRLLTTAFPLDQLTNILTSLKSGTFGVIIDGIDEGRLRDGYRMSENESNSSRIFKNPNWRTISSRCDHLQAEECTRLQLLSAPESQLASHLWSSTSP